GLSRTGVNQAKSPGPDSRRLSSAESLTRSDITTDDPSGVGIIASVGTAAKEGTTAAPRRGRLGGSGPCAGASSVTVASADGLRVERPPDPLTSAAPAHAATNHDLMRFVSAGARSFDAADALFILNGRIGRRRAS